MKKAILFLTIMAIPVICQAQRYERPYITVPFERGEYYRMPSGQTYPGYRNYQRSHKDCYKGYIPKETYRDHKSGKGHK